MNALNNQPSWTVPAYGVLSLLVASRFTAGALGLGAKSAGKVAEFVNQNQIGQTLETVGDKCINFATRDLSESMASDVFLGLVLLACLMPEEVKTIFAELEKLMIDQDPFSVGMLVMLTAVAALVSTVASSIFKNYTEKNGLDDSLELVNELELVKQKNAIQDQPTSLGMRDSVNRLFWSSLGCWSTYSLVDAGLARFLVLETLTHGCGPLGFIGINLNGADPNYGGGKTGSSVATGDSHFIRNSKNFFHVFKDTEIAAKCLIENKDFVEVILRKWIGNKLMPRRHAILSGMSNFGYSSNEQSNVNIFKGIIGGIVGFLTPTLKFRFKPEVILNCSTVCKPELENLFEKIVNFISSTFLSKEDPVGDDCFFENDPDYSGLAYRTTRAIDSSQLGITGSLSQGLDLETLNRMRSDPEKVLLGMTLLLGAALTAKTTYQYIKTSSVKKTELETQRSCFQSCKKKIGMMTVASCWLTIAVTAIFLNTI